MTFEEREKLIALCRSRCAQAKARYELAVQQTQQLADAVRQSTVPAPDGSFALGMARREETAALSTHVRLMKICLGIMRGETPDDEEWRNDGGL